MSAGGQGARRGAVWLVRAALEEDAPLDEAALPDDLPPPERARALTLARETMRRLGAVDAVLAGLMKREPAPPARALIRVGATEILALDGAPHGVVDAMVTIAKGNVRTRPQAGFVNAILRRVATECAPAWAALDHGRAAMPDWLFRALRADWGKEGVRAIAAAHLAPAPLDLTPRDGDAAGLAARLGGAVMPTGSVRLTRAGKLSDLDGYEAGEWWAQDAAAAVPARLAGHGNGRRALDLCAAPGGKTMQLAAAGWAVTALDMSSARMGRVRENLARTRLSAEIVTADALTWEGGLFDLVLLDAPCTATGTIRRHPELPHIRDGSALKDITALQDALLDAAFKWVAPGGQVIFCTCSLFRAEGEARINAFLKRTEGATRAPFSAEEIGDPALCASTGDFRARPDFWAEKGGIDGFYAARLRRAA